MENTTQRKTENKNGEKQKEADFTAHWTGYDVIMS